MSFEHASSLAQLLLVPMVGLLWRIDTRLAGLAVTVASHGARLKALDGREA